jgi:precorrin-2/cobalt-factor-2 C20-methyltransferase
MKQTKLGILYGVGVGPGDPRLLTLRAMEVIQSIGVVFAASSPKNGYSLALNTVQDYLPSDAQVTKMPFPMTNDRSVLEKSWKKNALTILQHLQKGQDVAFLTIGDPLTYSTYGYLMRTIRNLNPQVPMEAIPGITAYQAAAARLNIPLVESKESLMIVSGVSDPQEISRLAEAGDNLVIMKAYRKYDEIIQALEDLPQRRKAAAASMVCLPQENLEPDAYSQKGGKMPYLTLLLVKKNQE